MRLTLIRGTGLHAGAVQHHVQRPPGHRHPATRGGSSCWCPAGEARLAAAGSGGARRRASGRGGRRCPTACRCLPRGWKGRPLGRLQASGNAHARPQPSLPTPWAAPWTATQEKREGKRGLSEREGGEEAPAAPHLSLRRCTRSRRCSCWAQRTCRGEEGRAPGGQGTLLLARQDICWTRIALVPRSHLAGLGVHSSRDLPSQQPGCTAGPAQGTQQPPRCTKSARLAASLRLPVIHRSAAAQQLRARMRWRSGRAASGATNRLGPPNWHKTCLTVGGPPAAAQRPPAAQRRPGSAAQCPAAG